jgi:hypothetical protein
MDSDQTARIHYVGFVMAWLMCNLFLLQNKKKVQAEAEFDDSDLDLDKEMHPIGYYVKDRENLLSEMFHCVKGQSLNRALPDVLKVNLNIIVLFYNF